MPGVVRLGDLNSAGGATMLGNNNCIVDGKPVVTIGTPVTPHVPFPYVPIHGVAVTIKGSSSFIVNGKPVNVIGNPDSCGHFRVSGSKTFIIGS
jgi:uncharacterized Zn-binding protein involved in type VI secretion